MKKLSLIITAILIMSFIIIPTNFVQAASMDEIIMSVEQTNVQINEEIEKAIYAAQGELDDYNYDLMVLLKGKKTRKINEEVKRLNDNYNAEIDRIINNLLEVTNGMSAKMIEAATNEGVTVYCEWVEVTLGGRTILVDPLRIGND